MRWSPRPRRRAGIALFMTSLVISGCEQGPPSGLLTSPEAQQAGAVIYAQNCAICHGAHGEGNGARHDGMNPPPRISRCHHGRRHPAPHGCFK